MAMNAVISLWFARLGAAPGDSVARLIGPALAATLLADLHARDRGADDRIADRSFRAFGGRARCRARLRAIATGGRRLAHQALVAPTARGTGSADIGWIAAGNQEGEREEAGQSRDVQWKLLRMGVHVGLPPTHDRSMERCPRDQLAAHKTPAKKTDPRAPPPGTLVMHTCRLHAHTSCGWSRSRPPNARTRTTSWSRVCAQELRGHVTSCSIATRPWSSGSCGGSSAESFMSIWPI
jgi:hypothetical protein